jgi:hypothetical protein
VPGRPFLWEENTRECEVTLLTETDFDGKFLVIEKGVLQMKTLRTFLRRSAQLGVIVPFAALLCGPSPASAGPILGSAQNFAVLGASTVTNTGSTTINGDLGIYPGSAITNTGTFNLIGASAIHNTPLGLDPISIQAQSDALTAYNTLKVLPFTGDLTGQDLGTVGTLTPGVYKFDSSAGLTGTLTLDALNNPNALFVFEIGTALTTASASVVNVLNGGANDGVYWLMGVTGGSGTGSATLGTSTVFAGNILALDSITLDTTAKILCGRAIALNAAVTMDTNTISNDCNAFNDSTTRSDFSSVGFSGPSGGPTPVPEPGTFLLFGFGLTALFALRKKFFAAA